MFDRAVRPTPYSSCLGKPKNDVYSFFPKHTSMEVKKFCSVIPVPSCIMQNIVVTILKMCSAKVLVGQEDHFKPNALIHPHTKHTWS